MVKLKVLFVFLTFSYSNILHAADLRGKLTGLPSAKVIALCGSVKKVAVTTKSGSFHITQLPINKSCHFSVEHGGSRSVNRSFHTKSSVTDFQGSLRKVGKKIIVVRS